MERITAKELPKGWYETMLKTEGYLKKAGIDQLIYHLVKFRASAINGCGYCLDMHAKEAVKDGETHQRLYLSRVWREATCFTPQEAAALHLTEALTGISHTHPESAFNHASEHFSKAEIANLVLLICQINSWNRIAITFGYEPGSYKG